MQNNNRSIPLVRLALRRSILAGLDTNLYIQRPALLAESLISGKLACEKSITRNYNLEIKHLLTWTEYHDNSEMQLRDLNLTAAAV